MTEHDRVRMKRALECDREDEDSLSDAIRGLQSTDEPGLNSLHDELMACWLKLRKRKEGKDV